MLNITIVPKGSNRPTPTGYAIMDGGQQVGLVSMKTKTKWLHSRSMDHYCKTAKEAYREWLQTYVAFDDHIEDLLSGSVFKADLIEKQVEMFNWSG